MRNPSLHLIWMYMFSFGNEMGLYPEAAIWEYAEAQIPQSDTHLLS